MDKSSGIGGLDQSHLVSAPSRPPNNSNAQTITPTRGLRDQPASEKPTTLLSQRTVDEVKPTSYLGWLSDSAKEAARTAALFSCDLAHSTYQTLTEGWSSLGQGVSEASKFGIGTLGLAASLTQAGLAAAGELADANGIAVADSKVDMLGWALAKAGIKTVGVPKSELRQLGMTLAGLHLGKQQDISITQGKLELTCQSDQSNQSDSSSGLKWGRSSAPERTAPENTSSTPVQTAETPANSGSNSDAPRIRVGNIHLDGIQPGSMQLGENDRKGHARECLTIKADRLAFEVEYMMPPGSAKGQEQPITLSVEIKQPELIGESNLLSLVAMSINRYCSGLEHHLPEAIVPDRDDSLKEPPPWNQEETGVQLRSQLVHIEVKNIKSLAPDMSDYIPDVTSLSLIDLNAGMHQSLIGDRVSKPNVFFNKLQFSDNQTGPFHIQTGQMKLDEDMNGTLDIMVQTPFSKLEGFMQQLPDAVKQKITRNKSGDKRLGIMIHLDIARGEIDLNTLTTMGVSDKKLTVLQTQIEKSALRALKSEHTKLRDLPSGNKELKIDSVAISDKAHGLFKNKFHGLMTKHTSSYHDLGDKPYIKTGPKGRGQISLPELLQMEIKPESNPQSPPNPPEQ